MSVESALSYAALILADSEVEISSDKLLTLTGAANIPVEGIWTDIYSKALEGQDLKELLVNFNVGPSAAGGAATGPAPGAEGAAEGQEEKKKEEEAKEESDDDMGFGLFD